jgi:hypothetical protein
MREPNITNDAKQLLPMSPVSSGHLDDNEKSKLDCNLICDGTMREPNITNDAKQLLPMSCVSSRHHLDDDEGKCDCNLICEATVDGGGNLFLGGSWFSESVEFMRVNHIDAVLVCGYELTRPFLTTLQYKQLLLDDVDDAPLSLMLPGAIEFIHEHLVVNKRNVLVHCRMGISRSASIVIAYLIMRKRFTFNQAFHHVKSKRSKIAPNAGFLRLLKTLEPSGLYDEFCKLFPTILMITMTLANV